MQHKHTNWKAGSSPDSEYLEWDKLYIVLESVLRKIIFTLLGEFKEIHVKGMRKISLLKIVI